MFTPTMMRCNWVLVYHICQLLWLQTGLCASRAIKETYVMVAGEQLCWCCRPSGLQTGLFGVDGSFAGVELTESLLQLCIFSPALLELQLAPPSTELVRPSGIGGKIGNFILGPQCHLQKIGREQGGFFVSTILMNHDQPTVWLVLLH